MTATPNLTPDGPCSVLHSLYIVCYLHFIVERTRWLNGLVKVIHSLISGGSQEWSANYPVPESPLLIFARDTSSRWAQ